MSYPNPTKKRVTFAAECKTYDGFKTRHNFLYAAMCAAAAAGSNWNGGTFLDSPCKERIMFRTSSTEALPSASTSLIMS